MSARKEAEEAREQILSLEAASLASSSRLTQQMEDLRYSSKESVCFPHICESGSVDRILTLLLEVVRNRFFFWSGIRELKIIILSFLCRKEFFTHILANEHILLADRGLGFGSGSCRS